jgi:hypothetical protein
VATETLCKIISFVAIGGSGTSNLSVSTCMRVMTSACSRKERNTGVKTVLGGSRSRVRGGVRGGVMHVSSQRMLRVSLFGLKGDKQWLGCASSVSLSAWL